LESSAGPNPSAWLIRQTDKEAKSDVIRRPERISQLVALAAFVLVIIFVAIHQTRPTGFFTEDDGATVATVLYVMIVLGMPTLVVKLLLGRKNASRPFEIFGNMSFVVGSIYLLAVFPFDFSYFADPLPKSLEFLLDWVSADLAKIVLVIGSLGGTFAVVYNSLLYVAVKAQLSKATPSSDKSADESAGPVQ
jgi:hypothetical protein